MDELEKTGSIRSTYTYPIQVIQFGGDLTLIALAGETVVDFSLRLKRELRGNPVWVAGYSNDVFAYVPSARILLEGGYEAEDSLWYYDRPGRISTNAEDLIINTVHGLLPKNFLKSRRIQKS